jgi:phospholipase/lecithinase/hemolysin
MPSFRHVAPLAAFWLLAASLTAHAQAYTSIVVFGDSLSDTGNDAALTQAKYGIRIPGLVADYTDGRFTDGSLTFPASYKYAGVWIEQLASMLPNKPVILDSLNGGANYAYGFAFTGSGTTDLVLSTNPPVSVNVDNIGLQISTYLATHPRISDKTLFVVWGGANDVLNATKPETVLEAAATQSANVERLVEAGATQILVANLPPLGAIPRLNTTSSAATATEASVLFNDTLSAGLDIIQLFNSFNHLSLYRLDVYSLFSKVIASPATYALTNVKSMSQAEPVNPDAYLFWDDLHPTTRGHNLLAIAAATVLEPAVCKAIPTDYAVCPNLAAATH